MNAGVAMRVNTIEGPQKVVVLGNDVFVNDVKVTESTDGVELKYWYDKDKIRITIGDDFKLVLRMKFTENVPTGYFMNLNVHVPEEETYTFGKTICGLHEGSHGDDLVFPIIKSSQTLFDLENYAKLVEICGEVPGDDYEIPEVPPTPEEVCEEMNMDYNKAKEECNALCSCATEEDINNCIFDYCVLQGDLTAALSCQDTCGDDDCEDFDLCGETQCDEGVANQYVYYETTIEELQGDVKDMEDAIDDLWRQIADIDKECPQYHYLHDEYASQWAGWDESNTDSPYWPLV